VAKLHKIIPLRDTSLISVFFSICFSTLSKIHRKMCSQYVISWHKVMRLLYDIVTELFLLFILPFQLINAPHIKNTEHVVLLKR